MSKINLEYYISFTSWWLDKIGKAVKNLDTVALLSLTTGMKQVMDSVFTTFKDFPELKGNGMSVALKLYAWIKTNPDPFKETRNLINTMRSKTLWQ